MPRIAEKLEFTKSASSQYKKCQQSRSVKKQVLEERQSIKSHVIVEIFTKLPRKRKLKLRGFLKTIFGGRFAQDALLVCDDIRGSF